MIAEVFVGNFVAHEWVLREENIPVASLGEIRNHSLSWNYFLRCLQVDTVLSDNQRDNQRDKLNLCSHEGLRGILCIPGVVVARCRLSRRMSDVTVAVDWNIVDWSWMSLVG